MLLVLNAVVLVVGVKFLHLVDTYVGQYLVSVTVYTKNCGSLFYGEGWYVISS